MQYRHTQFDETVNVTPTSPLKDFITYLVAIFLLVGSVYCFSIYAVELVVPYIDQKTEQRIWNTLFSERFVLDDPKRSDKIITQEKYLQELLNKIPKEELVGNDYKVIVEENDEVNAMALPSGKIIVYTGLLNKLTTENGIVFVLGHELGHFAHRDHLRGMGRSLIAGLLLSPLMADGNRPSMLGRISFGFSMHFSREQESAADEYGLQALVALYGHAGSATEFFDYIQSHENEKEIFILKYSSTHPISKDRIEHLNNLIKTRQIKILSSIPKKT